MWIGLSQSVEGLKRLSFPKKDYNIEILPTFLTAWPELGLKTVMSYLSFQPASFPYESHLCQLPQSQFPRVSEPISNNKSQQIDNL